MTKLTEESSTHQSGEPYNLSLNQIESEFKTEFWKKFQGQNTLQNLLSYFMSNYPYRDVQYKRNFALYVIGKRLIEKELNQRKLVNLIDKEIAKFDFSKFSTIIQENIEANKNNISIFDADRLDGTKFQDFVAEILKVNGYTDVRVIGRSGDQGGDILATLDNSNFVIQTKRYSIDRRVSNNAVQEVLGAIGYYSYDKGMVITNSIFTRSAKDLAQINNIILCDRRTLTEYIEKYNASQILS